MRGTFHFQATWYNKTRFGRIVSNCLHVHTLQQNLRRRYEQFIRTDGSIIPQRALPGSSAAAASSAPPPTKAMPTYKEVDGLGYDVARGQPPQEAAGLQPQRLSNLQPPPPTEAPTRALPPPPPLPASAQIREFMTGHAVEREHGYERQRMSLTHDALNPDASNAERIEACRQLASTIISFS